jgi:catechol 2,3-dioxygenase-like lactoylglutathione lyase family enzyme
MALKVLGFAGFIRRVRSLDRSIAFYCEGLGFEALGSGRLRLGEQTVELVEDASIRVGAGEHYAEGKMDTGFQHMAIVASDMDLAFRRLRVLAPRCVSTEGPVRLPTSAGGVTAFKFLDPDGRPLELIEFPRGSGDSRWQLPGAKGPTLGIDHSAIAISDLGRSIAFYRDTLGFTVSSVQRNTGVTQERLDGLVAVKVNVAALRPGCISTPHLELLSYVFPETERRPSPDCLVWRARIPECLKEREAVDPDGHRHILISDSIA